MSLNRSGNYVRNRNEMRGGDRRKTVSYSKEPLDINAIKIAMRKAKKHYGEDIYFTFNFKKDGE